MRLIIGPWNHSTMRRGITHTGDVDFGPESVWGMERYFAEQLRYFDRWLKDIATGVEGDPPVQIFIMGGGSGRKTADGKMDHGGRWRAEQQWPPARTRPATYYLHGDGTLALEPPRDSDMSLVIRLRPGAAGAHHRRQSNGLQRAAR